jgi:hypothetical protein
MLHSSCELAPQSAPIDSEYGGVDGVGQFQFDQRVARAMEVRYLWKHRLCGATLPLLTCVVSLGHYYLRTFPGGQSRRTVTPRSRPKQPTQFLASPRQSSLQRSFESCFLEFCTSFEQTSQEDLPPEGEIE